MNSHDTAQASTVATTVQDYAKLVGIPPDMARKVMLKSLQGLWEKEVVWQDSKGYIEVDGSTIPGL